MRNPLILVLFSLLFSCKSSVPKDILPPKKMQAVLWDVMQADELAEYYSSRDSAFKGPARHIDYYQKIFAIHKISKDDFAKSLNYYQNHPASLKSILDSLQRFEQRLQGTDSVNKKPNKPLGNDSVRRKLRIGVRPT